MSISDLPTLNASLNALAAMLLLIGYLLIKLKHRTAHKRTMITAFGVSVVFLVCYVVYHLNTQIVTEFRGPAALRTAYLTVLFTHIVLAAAVPPLCVVTLYRAWRGQFEKHRRIAKITFPIWLYVSVSGVVVYLVLYQVFPAGQTN